jgi:hypothetical protein
LEFFLDLRFLSIYLKFHYNFLLNVECTIFLFVYIW